MSYKQMAWTLQVSNLALLLMNRPLCHPLATALSLHTTAPLQQKLILLQAVQQKILGVAKNRSRCLSDSYDVYYDPCLS